MTFNEYLNEIENFSTRGERLADDCRNGMTYAMALEWVEAAYRVGYRAAMDDDLEYEWNKTEELL